MDRPFIRRDILRAAAGAAWMLAGGESRGGEPAPKRPPREIQPVAVPTVRIGLVGVGDRGIYLLDILLGMEGVQIQAACDLEEKRVTKAQVLVEERKLPKPQGYWGSETAYQRLCARHDVDLVINATPGPVHAPVCLAALKAGKHVATEAPLAGTIEECWQLVEAAEKAKRHCVLLENYCYQRDVLMVRNMVRLGFFGEIMHGEGGYQRDARERELRTNPDGTLRGQGEQRVHRKGNAYPTHDIGPLSLWMDIHGGDRFEYLVSMGGNARSVNDYGLASFGPDHPLAKTPFDMSDINLSLIRTVRGRTIYLFSDTLFPRPEPRNSYRLLGSKGIYDQSIDKLYFEGKSPKRDRSYGEWEPVVKYHDEFDHPLWKALRSKALGSGRAGGDFLCLYRLIQSLRAATRPDFDVYDAAAWSSIVELTERSARSKSAAIDFPDFTRGRWKTTPPTPIRAG